MTLSDEFCGAAEPPLENKDAWKAWLQQKHPSLRPFELEKEWQHRRCDAAEEVRKIVTVKIEISDCRSCPHRDVGFLYEPSTCVYGERSKTPYDFLCSFKSIPEHCPLR